MNVSQPGDPNDFNELGTTVLRIENVIGEIAPGLLTNGVRIDERRPARAGAGGQMQNVTIHLTGTAAHPLTIRTHFASGVTATTLAGEANDGADATSGFLCAGSDSAEQGHPGFAGNRLLVNVSQRQHRCSQRRRTEGGERGRHRWRGRSRQRVSRLRSRRRRRRRRGRDAQLNNTSITTSGVGASAITASSSGGKGGQGGDGGAFRYGSRGGVGGDGGTVNVLGSATLETNGSQALGIHAVSIGGDGGDGGDSSAFGGGGDGPLGAGGGTVTVNGHFDITRTAPTRTASARTALAAAAAKAATTRSSIPMRARAAARRTRATSSSSAAARS